MKNSKKFRNNELDIEEIDFKDEKIAKKAKKLADKLK